MPTGSIQVSYRPVRIGFLIRDGNIDEFIRSCQINTILWGGLYNPIIPVGKNDYLTRQLIKIFSIDVFFPLSEDPKIKSIINENPQLQNPRLSDQIFYEDWHSRKLVAAYLDVMHLIAYYWEKELKHSKYDKSNCVFMSWDNGDPLATLHTASFGEYSARLDLKINYAEAFKNGLRSKELIIEGEIDPSLVGKITPIKLTGQRLLTYQNFRRENGIYIGNPTDFNDLVLFWNLRASGIELIFLPSESNHKFKKFTEAFLNTLDEQPSRNPNFKDLIGIYYSNIDEKKPQNILNSFKTTKQLVFSHITDISWNGLNIRPCLPIFKPIPTMSIIEKSRHGYSVVVQLPEKPFSEDYRNNQDYAVTLQLYTEFEYPEYTLRFPYLPDLNEFYSRESFVQPWSLRAEKEGFSIIENLDRPSLQLSPIKIVDIIIKIFERANIVANMNPAGRIARLIIQKMGGIEGCRVFKVRGVRRLIKEAKKRIKWSEAKGIIWKDEFQKFHDLYIEQRKRKNLTPDAVLQYLLKKEIFIPEPATKYKFASLFRFRKSYKNFNCENCGYKSKIFVLDFQSYWKCSFCEFEHYLPLYLEDTLRNEISSWFLKRSGLFAKDNNQEGSIPVILTLMQLNRLISRMGESQWCTSLELDSGNNKCEIDFVMIDQGRRCDEQDVQIAIGECKEHGEIDDADIDNLCMVKEKLEKSGLDCYLVFSKAADSFLPTELDRFKRLIDKRIEPILFTNTELEPYSPYWSHPKAAILPHKHAINFEEIAHNSKYLYLTA